MGKETIVTESDVPEDVREAIAAGQKIIAIKLLREATGIGLANAKVIVDRMASDYSRQNPEQSAISEESSTPKLLFVMVFVAAIFVAWRFFLSG